MEYPKVTILILNWNGKEDTIECLESLRHINYPNYDILLVDNGSIDGSVKCFRETYPDLEIIENGENLGFAEGNNVGIRKAMDNGKDYMLLLNNDTVVDCGFLGELVEVAESDSKIGIVGPKIYYYDYNGRKDVIWSAGGKINLITGKTSHINGQKIDDESLCKPTKVDYISGCAFLVKKDVFDKIGLLDPEYFAYFEEADFCVRASKIFECVYVPQGKIWHKVSKSTGGNFSPIMAYYLIRNRFLFTKKNGSKYLSKQAIFICAIFIYSAKKLLIYSFKFKMDVAKSICKGFRDGLKFFIEDSPEY